MCVLKVNNGNRIAIITGASSGLGEAYARKLATGGYNLILIARREERLSALKNELENSYSITAEVLAADLTRDYDIKRVETRIHELGHVDMLINNAGFGTMGEFAQTDLEKQIDMITLHVVAPTRLIHAVLPKIARNGSIINVSSLAAFISLPDYVTYNATKAYLVVFSKTLQSELKGTGIHIQVLCPGFIATEFHSNVEEFNRSAVPQFLWMTPQEVVKESLRGIEKGTAVCVPGFKNRFLFLLIRIGILTPLFERMLRS
ncbi:MAG: SDR family oxidoreductase [Theionarchaea archaeon]|nr:SDR family oxidoreductase [Theionarchaea archaeon]